MLLGGDELARTQHGNNNAWCQDNEISWYDWELDEEQCAQLEFTRGLIALRKAHPVFRRAAFLVGHEQEGSGLPDVWWFRTDGRRMTQRDWQFHDAHTLGVFLNGEEIPERDERGEPIEDDSFLLLFNAHYDPVTFTLPARRFGTVWTHELCTARPEREPGQDELPARADVHLEARSLKVLRRVR
jgi:glycogen operon protein